MYVRNGKLRWDGDDYLEAAGAVFKMAFGAAVICGRILVVVAAGRIMGLW